MIEVAGLTKCYGEHRAVDDLSFTAPAGQVTGFVGPNGAGKTTTFRCLLGLAEPTRAPPSSTAGPTATSRAAAAGRRRAGVDGLPPGPQRPQPPARPRPGRRHRPARIDPLLDLVGLAAPPIAGWAATRWACASGSGSPPRLLGDPPTIVLDEPVNGLDPAGVAWVRRLLRAWADEGRTVLVSSHLLAELAQVADRVS